MNWEGSCSVRRTPRFHGTLDEEASQKSNEHDGGGSFRPNHGKTLPMNRLVSCLLPSDLMNTIGQLRRVF